ncbi:MAG: glycosyltransferase family 4 protein [Alphaproteobacteria bacterium]|nr:glycosyltransferase family 4 protein [Alphaproteobacteria bacterium]
MSGSLTGRTLLYLVTEDWYFWSHRLPFARAARKAGARVIVASRMAGHRDRIEAEGFEPVDIPFDRSGLNPVRDLGTFRAILALYRREKPDLVHHVAMKPVLYGGVAAVLAGVPAVINAMAGLGFLFIAEGMKIRLIRPIVEWAFRKLGNRRNATLIVQNGDDADLFADRIGVARDRIRIIRGSGVDIDRYTAGPEPDGIPVAVCVSRMLWDKGIGELVEAARILQQRGVRIRIRLVGPTDANPASIPVATLKGWQESGLVEVTGPSDDIPGAYRDAHIAVLPSYREGLPKSLLEGAACGRPVVATDVPGCREICRDGQTGIRVPLKSVTPLADALQHLAEDAELRRRLGAAARQLVEQEFAEAIVVGETLALYEEALQGERKT